MKPCTVQQNILDEPLPCTEKPSSFAILGDKGTIKRDVTQPTLIRTVCLRKNKLLLSKDCITWDIAHRIELACEDAKKETSWLQELDNTLQSIMKKLTMGIHHTHLPKIASE